MPTELKRITIAIEEDQYVGLEEVAADLGCSISEAAREAINRYLLEEHWKATVGSVARKAIADGLTNAEALEQVRERFPHARTSLKSVAWYRSRMRRDDPTVASDLQARHARGG